MWKKIKKILGFGPGVNYAELAAQGAVILDVRTHGEFAGGHIPGSINIPVDSLSRKLNLLADKNKTIIACCASGMRSAAAKNILASNGYTRVYNGGSWSSLKNKIG